MTPTPPRFQQRRERRRLLRTGLALAAGGTLAGCDAISHDDTAVQVLRSAESLNSAVQRALGRQALAQEFPPGQIAPVFRPNGTTMPPGPGYAALLANRFADWRLRVDGLVAQPLAFSLAQLQAMPARSQITRHDCVEGWSAIGQWTGPQLRTILHAARLKPEARYIVFHCADVLNGANYYESVDLVDAFHPQTIVAHQLNGAPLPITNGAPLRMRIERQLGYKHAKYVNAIEAVASLDSVGGGKGGFWEDRAGYQWYAGT